MTDMRATERLLEVIAEQGENIGARLLRDGGDAPAIQKAAHEVKAAAHELLRRGDTLVRHEDLRIIAAAANHGRQYGPEGDTDYTGFESALERIESALGGS
jgi:hypothetical protein